jgi:hypothetical protein
MLRLLLAALLCAGPALAGLGDGFGGGATGAAGGEPAGSIAYPALVNVQVGGYVSLTPTVSGLTPGTYTVQSGALPDGLSLNSSTGAITGSVTTTALLAGDGARTGRHLVLIGVGDAADTTAVVEINVYGTRLRPPTSLLQASATYVSGTNFIDAINGATWTKTTGTMDGDLTDPLSPLGYSHTFNGSTYFTGTASLTGSTARHTIAALVRDRAASGGYGKEQMPFGSGASTMWLTTALEKYTFNSPTYTSIEGNRTGAFVAKFMTQNPGVGITGRYDGAAAEVIYTRGTSATAQMPPTKLTAGVAFDLVVANYGYHGDLAEAAYWGTMLGDVGEVVATWCWDRGISLKDCNGANAPTATVTITPTAPAYERPVTCTGSYTLTGSTANADTVTWYASPSGDTGSCTGTSSYSCAVTVSPDAAGEGVTTVSITATGDEGIAVARQDVGFYVTGARDCFLSQSIDGANNTTNVDNDAVTTWVNLISTDRNVTQSTAGSKPSVQEGVGSGVYVQPLVTFNGDDVLVDDTAADWSWLHAGTDSTVEVVGALASGATTQVLLATNGSLVDCTSNLSIGYCLRGQSSSAGRVAITGVAADVVSATLAGSAIAATKYSLISAILDDDGAGGADITIRANDAGAVTGTRSGSYTATDGSAVRIGAGNTHSFITGSLFRVITYQSALTSTQRGINAAVDAWALGNALPVAP